MGSSVGIILLINKGNYDNNTEYKRLNWVRHNYASWVCKKKCIGVEPSDENREFWQILAKDGEKSPVMVGATSISDGESGSVPKPTAQDKDKYLRGDGTWSDISLDDKANGKGITFSIQDGIPYMSYAIAEDPVVDAVVTNIFDNDPTNDAETDPEVDAVVSNVFDDDPTNDAESDPEVDSMINNIFNT